MWLLTIQFIPAAVFWDGTCFFGASLAALEVVAKHHGYQLVYSDSVGVNAFFVDTAIIGEIPLSSMSFGGRLPALHHDCQGKRWVDISKVL